MRLRRAVPYLAAVLGAFTISLVLTAWGPAKPRAPSTVKVIVGPGHGSGVHIGHGLILTAWHVIHHDEPPSIKLAGMYNDSEALAAETLWSSKIYDIALLRMADRSKRPTTASLPCHTAPIGTAIEVLGHPIDNENVHSRGIIASKVMTKEQPDEDAPGWREIFLGDVAISRGNSGGPAFNSWGRVVGIVVGYHQFARGLAILVPSSTACMLMGWR